MARAHGLRGHVVVELVTNREERLAPGSVLTTGDGRALEVRAANPAGAVAGRLRYIVAFAGVDDRAAADALRGTVLSAAPLAEAGTLWVHQLVGARVRTADGAPAGQVVAVQANPASDLLVLDGGALVPLRFVTSSGSGTIEIDPPPGLLEL